MILVCVICGKKTSNLVPLPTVGKGLCEKVCLTKYLKEN